MLHRWEMRCPKWNLFLLLTTVAATKGLHGTSVAGYVKLGNLCRDKIARQIEGKIAYCNIIYSDKGGPDKIQKEECRVEKA